jgi:hypothetical protein
MRRVLEIGFIGLVLVTMAARAGAAAKETGFGYRGWGLRSGFSVDPDQFFFGGQVDLGEFAPNLRFKPNATIGFGDDMTLVAISPDISYAFPVPDMGALYVGGILAFEWWKLDVPEGYDDQVDDSDADIGVHIIGGLELQSAPVFLELNIGMTDEAPDLKLAVGYTFHK